MPCFFSELCIPKSECRALEEIRMANCGERGARQVRPDGVYFEQSLYYHVYALDFFLYARLLQARNGFEIPPAYDAVLQRMLDVVAALAQAGPAEGFGDDDGGRLWNPRRNRTEHMTDPLALGAMIYSREFPAAQLTEEAIWLFGNPAVDALSKTTRPSQHPRRSVRLPFPTAAFTFWPIPILTRRRWSSMPVHKAWAAPATDMPTR